jgi:hypothetical protein
MLRVQTIVTEADIGDPCGDVVSLVNVKTVETRRDGGTKDSAKNESD